MIVHLSQKLPTSTIRCSTSTSSGPVLAVRTTANRATTVPSVECPLGLEETLGFDTVYQPGSRLASGGSILRLETDAGVHAEVPGSVNARPARYLLGRNPLDRKIIWHDPKRSRRSPDGTPPGAVDIALWDFAGRLYDAPIYELLGGGWRKRLPAYASTYHGDENGGLTTAEDYGQFALRCKQEFGYGAFKIHGCSTDPSPLHGHHSQRQLIRFSLRHTVCPRPRRLSIQKNAG